MNLDFSTPGQWVITMSNYIDDILAAWKAATQIPDSYGYKTVGTKRKKISSAAPENLFVVDEDCKKLD